MSLHILILIIYTFIYFNDTKQGTGTAHTTEVVHVIMFFFQPHSHSRYFALFYIYWETKI